MQSVEHLLTQTWKVREVSRLTDAPLSWLKISMQREFPVADGLGGGGSQGKHHLFTFRNVMEFALARALTVQGMSPKIAFQAAAKVAYFTTRERGSVQRESGFPFPASKGVTVLAAVNSMDATDFPQVTTADRLQVFRGGADAVTLVNVSKVFRDVCERIGADPSAVLQEAYSDHPRPLPDPAAT
ncbi:hypothetical protein [Mameliella sp. MMSF_3455]|uniref:hypothetical protein n=1 Tax=Mameliella sp. MMSF_3455 TaxID=3046714 RepID=UPI00273F0B99|nr:hypothetical protein [Mameliella sp. MMSF_3455]